MKIQKVGPKAKCPKKNKKNKTPTHPMTMPQAAGKNLLDFDMQDSYFFIFLRGTITFKLYSANAFENEFIFMKVNFDLRIVGRYEIHFHASDFNH